MLKITNLPLSPHLFHSTHTDPLAFPHSLQGCSCLRAFVLAIPNPRNMLLQDLRLFSKRSFLSTSSKAALHSTIYSCALILFLFLLSRNHIICFFTVYHLYWIVNALSLGLVHYLERYLAQGRHLIFICLVHKFKGHKPFCYSLREIYQKVIHKLVSDGEKE